MGQAGRSPPGAGRARRNFLRLAPLILLAILPAIAPYPWVYPQGRQKFELIFVIVAMDGNDAKNNPVNSEIGVRARKKAAIYPGFFGPDREYPIN
jgi:hypothetical protein